MKEFNEIYYKMVHPLVMQVNNNVSDDAYQSVNGAAGISNIVAALQSTTSLRHGNN